MRRKLLLLFTIILIALIPGSALAQDPDPESSSDDVLLRINGAVTVDEGERVGSAFVISGDAEIHGTIDDVLLIIDGTATLSGAVDDDVVVVSGDLIMTEGASIGGDLNLYDSDVEMESGAQVAGDTNERSAFTWSAWDTFFLSVIFWIALTALVLVTALVFAGIGGRQLVTASSNLTERLPAALLAAILVGLLIPILAIVAVITLLGIPVGVTLLLVVLPMLGLLGYVVAGTRLGLALVGRGRPWAEIHHPYLAALLGVLLLQFIGLIPFVGGAIALVAMVLGTGALALVAWAALAGERRDDAVVRTGPVEQEQSTEPR